MKERFGGARLMLRLPHDQKAWLEEQAVKNFTSANAEVVAAIRARMEADQARGA
jgi:hypothetical protein